MYPIYTADIKVVNKCQRRIRPKLPAYDQNTVDLF